MLRTHFIWVLFMANDKVYKIFANKENKQNNEWKAKHLKRQSPLNIYRISNACEYELGERQLLQAYSCCNWFFSFGFRYFLVLNKNNFGSVSINNVGLFSAFFFWCCRLSFNCLHFYLSAFDSSAFFLLNHRKTTTKKENKGKTQKQYNTKNRISHTIKLGWVNYNVCVYGYGARLHILPWKHYFSLSSPQPTNSFVWPQKVENTKTVSLSRALSFRLGWYSN